MKDFFTQCLKDLESLTGIRQLYFLQSDLEDGERKKNVLIDGMVATRNQFDYIPDEAIKKIVREQMVKDQDYDALNSRVLFKWLNMHKDVYFAKAQTPFKIDSVDLTEEQRERIDKLANEYKASLINDFKPVYKNLEYEIERIKKEDEERQQGRKAIASKSSEYMLIREKRDAAIKTRGIDTLPLSDLKRFAVENEIFYCRSLEEAQEIYAEVYL